MMEGQGEGRAVPRLASVADWVAVVWGIVVRPLETLTGLAETQAWRKALGFYLAMSLAGPIVNLTQFPQEQEAADLGLEVPAFFRLLDEPIVAFGIFPIVGTVFLVLVTGLLYQIGLRQGGTGPFERYLTTEGFQTGTTSLVSLPFTLLVNLIQRVLGQEIGWLSYLILLPTTVWGIVLSVVSLRASMRLSTRGAIVTILIAVVIGVVALGVAMCVALGFAVAG